MLDQNKNGSYKLVESYFRFSYEDIIVHTNSIEGFWNILKKQIDGIHHSVSAKHLQRYCNESAFRYNHRKVAQDECFADALANCNGFLKYKVLTVKEVK